MRKLLFASTVFLLTGAAVQAQDKAKPELSKEKKVEYKKMKEENLTNSFKEIGLPDEQVKEAREVIETAAAEGKELKEKSADLTGDEMKEKKEAINAKKNERLREILGDKYKAWQEIRKKQKAAEEEFAGAASKQ